MKFKVLLTSFLISTFVYSGEWVPKIASLCCVGVTSAVGMIAANNIMSRLPNVKTRILWTMIGAPTIPILCELVSYPFVVTYGQSLYSKKEFAFAGCVGVLISLVHTERTIQAQQLAQQLAAQQAQLAAQQAQQLAAQHAQPLVPMVPQQAQQAQLLVQMPLAG